jgi:hypothetical protein
MEPLPLIAETDREQEARPLHDARFTDPLEKKYEHMWTNLWGAANGMGGPVEDRLVPLWSDQSMPQAFRDRAMLVACWCEASAELSPGSRCTRFGFGGSLESLENIFPEFDTELFAEWFKEGLDYERENNVEIFGEYKTLNWSFELLERGLISEQELDDVLDRILKEEEKGKQRYYFREKPSLTPKYILETKLFGLDTGDDYFPPSPKGRAWAFNKLESWLKNTQGSGSGLPKWLSVMATGKQIQSMYSELIHRRDRKLKPEINWDELRPAMEYFGLELIGLNGQELGYSNEVQRALELAKSMGPANLDMQKSILEYILSHKSPELPFFDNMEVAEEIASSSGDQDMLKRLEKEKEFLRQYEAERKADAARRREEDRLKSERDPIRLRQGKNEKRYVGLLEILRVSR